MTEPEEERGVVLRNKRGMLYLFLYGAGYKPYTQEITHLQDLHREPELGEWVSLRDSRMKKIENVVPTEVHLGGVRLLTHVVLLNEYIGKGCLRSPDVGFALLSTMTHLLPNVLYTCWIEHVLRDKKRMEPEERQRFKDMNTMWRVVEDSLSVVTDPTLLARAPSLFLENIREVIRLELPPQPVIENIPICTADASSSATRSDILEGQNRNAPHRMEQGAAAVEECMNREESKSREKAATVGGVVVRVETDFIVLWCKEYNLVWARKSDISPADLWSLTSTEWAEFRVTRENGPVPHAVHRAILIRSAECPWNVKFTQWEKTLKVVGTQLSFMQDGGRILPRGERPVKHEFLPAVAAPAAVYDDIRPHRADFEATIILRINTYDEPFPWRVTHFCINSKEYTLAGYMSLIGHGRWQRERQQHLPRVLQPRPTTSAEQETNAALRGTLGWSLAPSIDSTIDVEKEPVLKNSSSLLVDKIEFARKPTVSSDVPNSVSSLTAAMAQSQLQSQPRSGYVMHPAVTTMPLKQGMMRDLQEKTMWPSRRVELQEFKSHEIIGVVRGFASGYWWVWTPEGMHRVSGDLVGGAWLRMARSLAGENERKEDDATAQVISLTDPPTHISSRFVPFKHLNFGRGRLVLVAVARVESHRQFSAVFLGNLSLFDCSLPSWIGCGDDIIVEVMLVEDVWRVQKVHGRSSDTRGELELGDKSFLPLVDFLAESAIIKSSFS